jgi:peptidoglycan hydrolase-like protein with peptidoglycan-binding domain
MMKHVSLCCLVILFAVASLRADETVRTVQSRLKAGGFYWGEVDGVYSSDTAAAITRYQIRNGLQITGKLDSQTSHALGLAADKPAAPRPKFSEDVWRYLRKGDRENIRKLMVEDAAAANRKSSPPVPVPAPAASPKSVASPARRTATQPPPAETPPTTANALPLNFNHERLRDYVGAFVLAGLDPQVGSEVEFFAGRVDYFGERYVSREKIRRDLQRYNDRWPERRFWLAGELEVKQINDRLRVTFPLRYELRSASRRSSGTVWKTLVLEKTGDDDLQIVAVNERKAR